MASLLKRPLDALLILCFLIFAVIALTIDVTQAVYGDLGSLLAKQDRVWPPDAVVLYYQWWCQEVDLLLGANPPWYQVLAIASPLVYVPFYLAAIYAFLNEKEWIRVPTLMWGWGLLLCMVAIVIEQLMGQHATKDVKMFFLAYGAYIVVPLVAMLRVAAYPVFGSSVVKSVSHGHQKSSSKSKRN